VQWFQYNGYKKARAVRLGFTGLETAGFIFCPNPFKVEQTLKKEKKKKKK
jgi:hypothetical protein